MSKFINSLEHDLNKTTHTENGALSYVSTLSSMLDFFSKCGALRGKKQEQLNYFIKAYNENSTLADKVLFYSRDIRNGQGERELFKNCINWLSTRHPEAFKPNLNKIAEFGRWDDLYTFIDTPLQEEALKVMKEQFDKDIEDFKQNKPISLLAKWLKSENTSSKKSKQLAAITRKYFNMSPKDYRQTLSKLRNHIEVVETRMSANKWNEINYEHVPSRAMKQYTKAFDKHDEIRYKQYLEDVKNGKSKINASTLYPYDIVHKYLKKQITPEEEPTYEELWKHLPNYFGDDFTDNVMCVVDVSGSMTWGSECSNIMPIDVAISLGLYMSERNNGPFQDYFITFSSEPQLVKIQGNSLRDKIDFISRANWSGSTNLQKTFELILSVGKKYNLKNEDMLKKLFIISDMQFDKATYDNLTTFEMIDTMYKQAGYIRPELIFWNINAHNDNPVVKDELGTYLVSGLSPSILSHALKCESMTPYEFMMDVLNSDRYKDIV